MNRALTLALHDARLQWRYGIYIAYAVVLAFYLAVLLSVGGYLADWLPGLVLFSDPSVLGFFFLGALMMMERAENTRNALAITPAGSADYLAGKMLTLVSASTVSVCLIAPFIHAQVHWPLLIGTTILTAIHFIGIGVPAALYFRTVTGYLMGAAAWTTPIVLPCLFAFADPMPLWSALLPAASQLRLLLVATGAATATPPELALMLTIAALAAGLGWWIGFRSLTRELGTR